MRKRLLLSGFAALVLAVALGGAALAGGGGGFGGPGAIKFQDVSASASLFDSSGNLIFLSVDRGIQTFRLRGVSGPPIMVGPETVVSYYGNNASTGQFFNGCLIVPDPSFTVASGLASAQLKIDPSIETACPGSLVAADAGGRPGLGGVTPDGGGGGGGGDAAGAITADLTWTSNGAVTDFSVTTSSRCQGAVAHAVSSSNNTYANVTGSLSLLTDIQPQGQFDTISTFDTTEVITGTFSNACTGA